MYDCELSNIFIRYLIDHKWFKQWKAYTGYHMEDKAGDEMYKPGPVYNSTLLEGSDTYNLIMYITLYILMRAYSTHN